MQPFVSLYVWISSAVPRITDTRLTLPFPSRTQRLVKKPFQLNKSSLTTIQYIPRNMHTVFALQCFVVVIHWLIFPYPSGLLHWHCGNLTIAPVPAKQPWWIWINTSCEFIMKDCITTTKQSLTKPCAYFVGYTVFIFQMARYRWHGKRPLTCSVLQTAISGYEAAKWLSLEQTISQDKRNEWRSPCTRIHL